MTEEELKNMLEHMHTQTRRIQAKAALAATTAQTSQRTKSTPSIIDAIRKGQMKEIAPKKFCNVQVSGNFKSWAKDMKEFIFWHDKDTKELIENFEAHWKMDERMKYADIKRCCADNGMEVEIDKALHMILGAFLEGESKVLSETAELSNPDNLEMHKSGLELWRLLKYNFDRSSAFNVSPSWRAFATCSRPRISRTSSRRSLCWIGAIKSMPGRRSHRRTRSSSR